MVNRPQRNNVNYSLKVTCKWTDDEIRQLIGEVRRYKCLFDESSPESWKHVNRAVAWQRISLTFPDQKFPLEQCHAKWNCLRTSYRMYANVFRKTGIKPKWIFYEQMNFIITNKRSERHRLKRLAVCLLYIIRQCIIR